VFLLWYFSNLRALWIIVDYLLASVATTLLFRQLIRELFALTLSFSEQFDGNLLELLLVAAKSLNLAIV